MTNLIDDWVLGVKFLNSDLSKKRKIRIDNSNIDICKQIISDFFGHNNFYINEDRLDPKLKFKIDGSNWLFDLLRHPTIRGPVFQIFQIAIIIDHFNKSNPSILFPLKRNFEANNYDQFRSYFFELYTFYLLDISNIPNNKKVFENKNELEGTCRILNQEFLFECRKVYHIDISIFRTLQFIESVFYKQLENKLSNIYSFALIGKDDKELKLNYERQLKNYLNRLKKYNSAKAEVLNYPNEKDILFSIQPYSKENELISNQYLKDKGNYYSIYCSTPSFVKSFGINNVQFSASAKISSSKEKILDVLIERIREKRKKRSNSSYPFRIYFFENEEYMGLDLPLIDPDFFNEYTRDKLQKYIESKSTNDIICIICKNSYIDETPKTFVEIFCRKELDHFKQELLKLPFHILDFNKFII